MYRLHTVLKIHAGWVKSLDVDPHGMLLASSSMDCTVKLTDMCTRQLLATVPQKQICEDVKFSRRHPYVFCASMDGLIRCYDLVDRTFVQEYYGHRSSVLCLDTDGHVVVSGSADCSIKAWDIRTGECTSIKGHTQAVNNVVLRDGIVYSSSMDGTVATWDMRSSRSAIAAFDSSVVSLAFCGETLLASTRKEVFRNDTRASVAVMNSILSLDGYSSHQYVVGTDNAVVMQSVEDEMYESFEIRGSADVVKVAGRTIVCGGASKNIEFLEQV